MHCSITYAKYKQAEIIVSIILNYHFLFVENEKNEKFGML